jgi:hypothetical protein
VFIANLPSLFSLFFTQTLELTNNDEILAITDSEEPPPPQAKVAFYGMKLTTSDLSLSAASAGTDACMNACESALQRVLQLKLMQSRQITEEHMFRITSLRFCPTEQYILAGLKKPRRVMQTTSTSTDATTAFGAANMVAMRGRPVSTSTQTLLPNLGRTHRAEGGGRSSSRSAFEDYVLPATAVCEVMKCSTLLTNDSSGNNNGSGASSSCGGGVERKWNVLEEGEQGEESLIPIAVIESDPLHAAEDSSVNMALWHPTPGNGLFCGNVSGVVYNYHHAFPKHTL